MQKLYMKTAIIVIMAWSVILFSVTTLFAGQEDTAFQLFFTSDLYGYLKPCG
ncbi:MAG: hypothetical protein ACE5IW_06440 [bacterium]